MKHKRCIIKEASVQILARTSDADKNYYLIILW